jgi:hypothetical protein
MSGISPSNFNGWDFNFSPDPFYPENDQDDDLEGLWASLVEAQPLPSIFLPEEDCLTKESQIADISLPEPTDDAPAMDSCPTHNFTHAAENNDNNEAYPLVLERQQSGISSTASNFDNSTINLSEPRLPAPMASENSQESYGMSLFEKFTEALSHPPQFALEKDFKMHFWILVGELQSQAEHDPGLKLFFDKVIQALERPDKLIFATFFQPIHLGTDRHPMKVVGIAPSMEPTSVAPQYFNKTIQDLLLLLLAEALHATEGKLFEFVFRIHQKLNYPKIIYKSSTNDNSIVKILCMNIIQFTLFHNKIIFLRLLNLRGFSSHFTNPLTYQLVYEPRSKFQLLLDKNIKLTPIEQSLFYIIFNKPNGLEDFFKTTPFDVIEELADYLLQLLLRGYPISAKESREYRPFQDLDIIRNFLSKIASLSIKFNLDEKEKRSLLVLVSKKNLVLPQTILNQFHVHQVPSQSRISKQSANHKDEVYICEKFQRILAEKSYSLFVQGHNLSNEDLNLVVLASLFEKDHFATILLHFLSLKKTSPIAQKMTAGFIRKLDSYFHPEIPGNTRFDASLILENSYVDTDLSFQIPPEIVKVHVAFILEFFSYPNTISAYLNFLGSHFSSSQFAMILNFKFKFEISSARRQVSIINSSIISLIYPILSKSDWRNFSIEYRINVSFCHQTLIFVAHLARAGKNAQITGAPFVPLPSVLPVSPFLPPSTPFPSGGASFPAQTNALPGPIHLPETNGTLFDIKYFLANHEHLLVQTYKKLAHDLLTAWSLPEPNELFIGAFIAGKGIWGFDLNPASHLKLLRQPLEAFLVHCTERDRQLISAIIQDIIKFFHFFDSSKSSSNDSNLLTNLLPQSQTPELFPSEPLSLNENLRVANVFLDLKISEFKRRIEDLKYCLFKEKKDYYVIPCYFVTGDLQCILVRIMQAHFNEENSLVKLSASSGAACHLLQTIAPQAEVLKTIAQLTVGDLQNLHQAILTANEPCALILARQQAADPISGNKKRKHESEISSNQQPKYPFGFEEFWKLQSLTSLDALETKVKQCASKLKYILDKVHSPIPAPPQVHNFSPAPNPSRIHIHTFPPSRIPFLPQGSAFPPPTTTPPQPQMKHGDGY